jgi:hypothetical protein
MVFVLVLPGPISKLRLRWKNVNSLRSNIHPFETSGIWQSGKQFENLQFGRVKSCAASLSQHKLRSLSGEAMEVGEDQFRQG